jgi:hypothetical protein
MSHPNYSTTRQPSANLDPLHHTIIIEANIHRSEKEQSVVVDNFWRHRILTTCGDDKVIRDNKHVDPALCLCYGAKFTCVMGNKALNEDVLWGNGTMCRFRSIKLKPDATSVKTKLFHGRKLTTINARDIEYMECEVIDNSSHIKKLSCQLQLLYKKKEKHKREIKKCNNRSKEKEEKRLSGCKQLPAQQQ